MPHTMCRSRRLVVAAVVVILLQFGSAAVSALVLCGVGVRTVAPVTNEHAHCEGLGPGHICPMHANRGGSPATATPERAPGDRGMRNGCPPPDVALVSLSVGFGVVGIEASFTPQFPSARVMVARAASVTPRSILPDVPPPRA